MQLASQSICKACRLSTSGSQVSREQAAREQDIKVSKRYGDIIGTCGPDPDKNNEYGLAFVVFGGVVRGDKASGLLANARVRLLKNQVVIT